MSRVSPSRKGIKSAGRRGGADRPAKGVKVSMSTSSGGKGYRGAVPMGSAKTNAKDPGFPKVEAPWPKSKSKKL